MKTKSEINVSVILINISTNVVKFCYHCNYGLITDFEVSWPTLVKIYNEFNDLISSKGVRYLSIKSDINVHIITISTVGIIQILSLPMRVFGNGTTE